MADMPCAELPSNPHASDQRSTGVHSRRHDRAWPAGDFEFTTLAESLPPGHAFHFMVGPSALTEVAVGPAHAAADPRPVRRICCEPMSEIREIVGWVQTLLAPLMSREDLDPPMLRRAHWTLFVLPTVLRPLG